MEKNNTPRIPVEPTEPQEIKEILPEEHKNPEEEQAQTPEKEQKDMERNKRRVDLWRRVEMALDYKKRFIDNPALEHLTAEEFSKKVKNFSEEFFLKFTPEVQEIIDNIWNPQAANLQRKEIKGEKLNEKEKEKLRQIRVLQENPDAMLYEKMMINMIALIEKKKSVDELKAGKKTLEQEFERLNKAGYGLPDLKVVKPLDISFKPFAVVLTLSEKDFNEQLNGGNVESSGTFWAKTPFIAIRKSEEEGEDEYSRDHEYTHAVLEGGIENDIFYLTLYKSTLEKSIEKGDNDATRATVEKISNDPGFLLNTTHNELLANWKQTEDVLHLAWNYDTEIGEGFSRKDFSKMGKVFATAGVEMRSFLRFLQEKSLEIPDEETRNILNTAKENLEQSFLQIATNIQEAGAIAKRISDEASQDQHMIMTILRPTEWKHVQNILAHKYGQEKVDMALKTYQEVRKFTPDVESLKNIVEKARKGEIHLTKEDIRTIQMRHIFLGKGKKDEPLFFEKFGDFMEYEKLMGECYAMAGYEQAYIFRFSHNYNEMWGRHFRQKIGDDPEKIETFYGKLNGEQQRIFRNFFTFELLDKMFEMKKKNNGEPITEDMMKDDLLWQCAQKDWCVWYFERNREDVDEFFGRKESKY